MDRRLFVTSVLMSAGILAVTIGTANALPASRDHLVPAGDGNIETVWWRRRWHWRRRRHWHRRWRRW